MKENKGVTLVALVVTIIILIVLAGISINLALGENGLISKAKQAKENMELAQIEEETNLNQLYTILETEGITPGDVNYDAITKLAEFKKQISDYIEEAGGIKPEYSAETTTFGDSIKTIVKEVTKTATATAENISEGKTAWVDGQMLTGTAHNTSTEYIEFRIGGYRDQGSQEIFRIKPTDFSKVVFTIVTANGFGGNTIYGVSGTAHTISTTYNNIGLVSEYPITTDDDITIVFSGANFAYYNIKLYYK